MEGEKLAIELLRELKKRERRWFALFLITLILLFASNIIWVYAWCLPREKIMPTHKLFNEVAIVSVISDTEREVCLNGTQKEKPSNPCKAETKRSPLSKRGLVRYDCIGLYNK
jgi:hypothetical protein